MRRNLRVVGALATMVLAVAATTATYVVVSGDSLSRIAARNGTTVQALVDANHIENPNSIAVGQVLIIPNDKAYIVQAGDTLEGIAKQLGITVERLARANGITRSEEHTSELQSHSFISYAVFCLKKKKKKIKKKKKENVNMLIHH